MAETIKGQLSPALSLEPRVVILKLCMLSRCFYNLALAGRAEWRPLMVCAVVGAASEARAEFLKQLGIRVEAGTKEQWKQRTPLVSELIEC